MRLNADYVMLSTQLLLVVFDLAYDLSSEYRRLYPFEAPYYNQQYSIKYLSTLFSAKLLQVKELFTLKEKLQKTNPYEVLASTNCYYLPIFHRPH